jgi:ThiF family
VRPVLSPAARRLWRDPQTLQLGRPPGPAVLLTGLDPATRRVLPLLDGTRDTEAVVTAALAAGCPSERTRALLGLLDEGGLLADAGRGWPVPAHGRAERDRLAPDAASLSLLHGHGAGAVLERRAAARVVVVGAGRVGASLAALLAAAGTGAVDVVDREAAAPHDAAAGGFGPADAGRPRGEAARDRMRAVAPATSTAPQPAPDLVVLAPPDGPDEEHEQGLGRTPVPHLVVEVRATVGVVGPLVVPGHGPCLRCLDLVRSDLDPAWPVLAAQLATSPRRPGPCDATLAAAVAAQGAHQALSHLDGTGSVCAGGTLELALPDWRWRRRSWPVHPQCDCRWRAAG